MRSLGVLLHAAERMSVSARVKEVGAMLFVGDDWAEDHHDVELVDEHGKVLAKKRFPEGLAGVTAVARPDRRAPAGPGARPRPGAGGDGRDRDRARPVGRLAGRGRVHRVRDQPEVGGAVPGAALDLRGEVRRGRCARVGRDRPPGPGRAPPGRRGQHLGRRASSSPRGRIRGWCGNAPGMCCGCGARCGSSIPLRCRRFRTSMPRTRSSCWPRPRTRTRRRALTRRTLLAA